MHRSVRQGGTANLPVTRLPGPVLAGYGRGMAARPEARYAGHRHSAEIIAGWMWTEWRKERSG